MPDDVLWYVPFEALVPDDSPDTPPLISRFTIRYAPFASLAVGRREPKRRDMRTGVFVDKLFPRDDDATAHAAFTDLAGAIKDTSELPVKSPVSPRLYAGLVDQLIVLGDVETDPRSRSLGRRFRSKVAARSNPLRIGCTRRLAGLIRLCSQAFEPSRRQGLSALRRRMETNCSSREHVFRTRCADGVTEPMANRRANDGRSRSRILQESPHMPAADAWQRAVFLTMESPINPPREPRVSAEDDTELTAKHPFFWAGYMLASLGEPNEEALDDAINVGAANNAEPAKQP